MAFMMDSSCQLHEHALHLVDGIAVGGGLLRMLQAIDQPGGDQLEPGLLERLGRRRELGDDVSTLPPFIEHALDTLDLPGHAAQPLSYVVDDILREFHASLLSFDPFWSGR